MDALTFAAEELTATATELLCEMELGAPLSIATVQLPCTSDAMTNKFSFTSINDTASKNIL
jgi:hypothetical protein